MAPGFSGHPEKISEIIRGLLRDPRGTFRLLREIPFNRASVYFLIMTGFAAIPVLLLIGAIDIFLLVASAHTIDPLTISAGIGIFLLGFAGSWLVFTFLVHVVLAAEGRTSGIRETFVTGFYAITPFALLYWIPMINIITPFWALGLMVYGLQDRQDVPEKQALISVVVAVIGILVLEYLIMVLWLNTSFLHSFI